MKDLSIEEKAKRYDEAIERAKKWYNAPNVDKIPTFGNRVIEEIFPELKESEDELHRKWILEYLYDGLLKSDEQFKDQFKRAIAWLEKQGEHTNFRNKIQIGDKVTRNEDGVLVNLSQLKRVAKKDEKQGEQKPATMSLDEAIEHCKEKSCGNSECALEHKQLEKWLTELKELKEQKPTWSEEDEKIANSIWDSIDKSVLANYGVDKDKAFEWLKSLKGRVQPKQEWSEEEKKRIDRIIDVLDWAEDKGRISYSDWEDYVTYVRCLCQQPDTKWYKLDDNIQKKIINYFEYQREIEPKRKDILNTWIDWLKSLRPQNWKPSEGHLKALEDAMNKYHGSYSATLCQLYGELENLKE